MTHRDPGAAVTLLLVRHGRCVDDAAGVIARRDSALSDEGRSQLLRLVQSWDGNPPKRLVASDLSRARESVRVVKRVLLAWSSGKDSAWALHVLRAQSNVEVVGLLTTLNGAVDRVAMHGVRRELVELQASAAGLPLISIPLPSPCSNEDYERLMSAAMAEARSCGVTHVAFGDLFLEDVREYRIAHLRDTGVEPLFPIWGSAANTRALAKEMIASRAQAVIVCVDSKQLDPAFLGREFDEKLLSELPASVDPCGERGEFHTFCYGGPAFRKQVRFSTRIRVTSGQFHFIDLVAEA